ncbi:MAG: hypothetical protein A2Y56_04545 [Candidatus Aminicenantes bacterium RBG_13_63_10]|nr:MAG: hypothetical protein A2Y56_04545 [Candidatus Aminicenantes bacterium RBG_13_63_10]
MLAVGLLSGSWRTSIAVLVQAGNYAEAAESLAGLYPDLDTADKAEASALLAFLFAKQNASGGERQWLFEFFVVQGEGSADLSFLETYRNREVTAYLNGWRIKYPRLREAWIITRKGESSPAAPAALVLGLETQVEMLFKLSDEQGPLRGGVLHRGLNLIAVEAGRLFDSSRTHLFTLDLKSGGIEIREELALEVRLSSEPASSGAPRPMDLEYKVTLFAGGRQVGASRKTGQDKNPLALDIPKANLRANPMFKPPGASDDPFDPSNRGVSILDAIGVAYGLLQDLFKDKTRPYESTIEKKSSENYVYYAGSEGGKENRITALVTLKARGVSFKD